MTKGTQSPNAEQGFASAAMVALVAQALRTHAPELLPSDMVQLDAIRQARCDLGLKRELLDRAHEGLGSRFVFDIGKGIHGFGATLILQPFLRSNGGEVLLEKWTRLERYGHSRHRTRVERRAPGDYLLQRHALSGPPPGASHNLFVLGLLTAMLEAIGVEQLCVSLSPGDRVFVQDGRRVSGSAETLRAATDRWLLRWKTDCTTRDASASDLREAVPERQLASRIHGLLSEDPSRSWSLGGMADIVGASRRSLQRRLCQEGTSFSELVRSVRVGEASRLLETSSYSVTEIGYLCGFADSAQFSRDFRSSTGTSPSEFRAVATGRAPDSGVSDSNEL